jgi:hypothetical protein
VEEFAAAVFVVVVSRLKNMAWLYRQAARVVAIQRKTYYFFRAVLDGK